MVLIALDLATNTGVAHGDVGQPPCCLTKRFQGEDEGSIFAHALRWIDELIDEHKPDAVYVEAPMMLGAARGQTNARTIRRLNGLYAIVVAAVRDARIPCSAPSVGDIRQTFIGSRVIPGPEAKRRAKEMCSLLGWEVADRDQADAAALYYYAGCELAPNLMVPITPMMWSKVATTVAGEDLSDILTGKPAARKRRGRISAKEKRR